MQLQELVQRFFFVQFHSRAYGGQRYKSTGFLTNHADFLAICKQCDNSHTHLEWGYDQDAQQFATALEAEYPKGLCDEYAQILLDIARSQHIDVTLFKPKMHPHKQQSGRAVPPLIPEYSKVTTVLLQEAPIVDSKQKLIHAIGDIPAGSKLLRTEAKQGKEDLVIKAIFEMLGSSKLTAARKRLHLLQQWRTWAAELQGEERSIKLKMPAHVRQIMDNKRLALLQKISDEILGWPDRAVHQELQTGFRLVGEAPATGIFRLQPKTKTATMSEVELMMQSKFLRPAIVGKTKSAGKGPHSEALYDITLKEATEKRWLRGPFTFQQVSEEVGKQWLPVRRFCVEQKGKPRPIDDFCENQLNSAFTSVDKISLRTLDHVLWAALIICRHCLYNRTVYFVLKDEKKLSGPVHADWHGDSTMKVTALDLRSAYKQLPLNEKDVNKAVVTILCPRSEKPHFFLMHTLPFGASASVLHFNRISNLLWAIGCHLGLIWSSYYDDYPMLCPGELEQSTLGAAKALFNILGFDYAADKVSEPSERAEILGVGLDVAESRHGTIRVGNKKERVAEIDATLSKIFDEGKLRPKELPSHLGRLQFAC
eukprot:s1913_g3.t1